MHLMYFTEQPMSAYPEAAGRDFGATALMFSNKHFDPVAGSRLYNQYMALTPRRRFLIGAAALGAGSFVPLRAAGADPSGPPSLIPREVLFGNPDVTWARLSHDGAHLAYVAPLDGVRNLWVAPIGDLSAAGPLTRATVRPIASFIAWAFTHRHVIFFEDRDGDENWRASSVDIATGTTVPLTPERGVRAYIQEISHRFPREVLVGHNARDRRFSDLYRMDVVTGQSRLFFENADFASLLADAAFQVRLGSRYLADGSQEWLERRPGGAWALLLQVPVGDVSTTRLVGFSEDGATLYLFDSRDRDRAALVAMDMATRTRRILAEDPEADCGRLLLHGATRRPFAVGAMADRMRWQVIDPRFAADLRVLRAATPGDLHFTSASFDGRKLLVYIEHDTASPRYALYDRDARRFRPLFAARRRLDGLPLRPLEPVVIPARDGLRIPCYLTLPEPGARNVPMVLDIHGGPYFGTSGASTSPISGWPTGGTRS